MKSIKQRSNISIARKIPKVPQIHFIFKSDIMFKGRQTPLKFIQSTINTLITYGCCSDWKDDERTKNYSSIISQNLSTMEEIIVKKQTEGQPFSTEDLIRVISNSEFILVCLSVFQQLTLEHRKQFTRIFCGCVTYTSDHRQGEYPIISYIEKNDIILDVLLHFYDHPELAMTAGEMIRACASIDPLARLLIQENRINLLSTYFTVSQFNVSSDSFKTFKEIILSPPSAEVYVEEHFPAICNRINNLLDENNYTTCISTIQLIGDMLMKFINIQEVYLSDEKNLMLMMKLMLSTYKTIAKESYHIFKLFVAWEPKAPNILKLLKNNAEKLIPFLPSLIDDNDDPGMKKEMEDVINVLNEIISQ